MRRGLVAAIVFSLVVGACAGDGDDANPPAPGPTAGPSDDSPAPDTAVPTDTGTSQDTGPPPVTGAATDAPAGPPELPAYALEIQERGVVRVGILPRDFAPFISYDGTQDLYVGFEGTLARLLVAGTVGPIDVEYVHLSGGQRFEAVANGAVDFVVRMTAVNGERRQLAAFTTPYLMAGVAVMVPADSPVSEVADLRDLRLAVPAGSEMRTIVGDRLKELGLPMQSVQLGEGQDLWEAVVSGEADGYIDSWAVGVNRAATMGDVKVIPVVFTEGMAACTSLDNPEWAALLDARLRIIIEAGVWAEEFEKAFGFPPPWTLEEMATSAA
jgi:glutamate transport system substrate-binding protein